MYTAHYQGTAQVAVIAGLAESSGPLKAPKKFSGANCFLARRGHGLRPALRLAPPTYLKRTAGAEPASIFAGQVITLCHLQGFCRPGFQHSPDCERIRDLTLFRQNSGKRRCFIKVPIAANQRRNPCTLHITHGWPKWW